MCHSIKILFHEPFYNGKESDYTGDENTLITDLSFQWKGIALK